MTVKKQEVEIQEKPKTPEQEAMERLTKMLEIPVQPPPIEETLEKAKLAIEQAQKAKQKPQKRTWYCTDCGRPHVQNDGPNMTGEGHIKVDVMDGDFVGPEGQPLTGSHLQLMEEYAVPKAPASNHGTINAETLRLMKLAKGGGSK